jgi:hypothetical protein
MTGIITNGGRISLQHMKYTQREYDYYDSCNLITLNTSISESPKLFHNVLMHTCIFITEKMCHDDLLPKTKFLGYKVNMIRGE